MTDLLATIVRIPLHLLYCIAGLLLSLADDRTATLVFLGTVVLVVTWGWVAVGVSLVLYGVLLFANQAINAFLSRP